jgi:hypothetical protein
MILSLLIAAQIVGASPSAGMASTTAPVAAKSNTVSDDDKVICKNEAVLGTRIPSRTCATKREWDQRNQNGQDATGGAQQNGLKTKLPGS